MEPQADNDAGAVEEVVARFESASPQTEEDYRRAIGELRWRKSGVAQLALRKIYEAFIAGPGKDDAEARAALGYVEFEHTVPEEIAFRRYDYVRAVEKAREQRWFSTQWDKKDYELALRAWEATRDHAQMLASDAKYRAADRVLASMANDGRLANLYLAVRSAEPYVICYASTQRLSEYDAFDVPAGPHRTQAFLAARKAGQRAQAVLHEKARIVQGVHAEFLRRYGTKLGLKPLTDPHAGRPDYPVTERSFADGCPLLVWIFDSPKAFRTYHAKQTSSLVPHHLAGYFDPRTGAVVTQDEGTDDARRRALAIQHDAGQAVHQLVYWYTRQRNRWRKPRASQDWFGIGLAQYLGAVQLHADGHLDFPGLAPGRMENMQRLAKMLQRQGKAYPIFPLERLARFASFGAVQQWVAQEWQLAPSLGMALFYEQAWALAHFLNEGGDRARRDGFTKLLDLTLSREEPQRIFAQAYGMTAPDDPAWTAMNEAFREHVSAKLMKLDPQAHEHEPPPLGSLVGK